MPDAGIAAIGHALPARVVGNDEIARRADVTDEWIVARTGVRQRRVAEPGERLADFAVAAGRQALERAGVEAGELDLVVVATSAADDLFPNAAPVVAYELGASSAGAFDVGAACTGFLSALDVAVSRVEAGRAASVLVVGADLMSRLTDPADRATAALFADGAGAAVVTTANGNGASVGPILLGADGSGGPSITANHTDRLIRMQGHDTFRDAVRRLSEYTRRAARAAGVELDDVDLFVYHQANARILSAVADGLGLDRARVVDCIDRYGNTSSATIPIALAEAEHDGRLFPGATVVLAAFGAGFTFGSAVLRWGEAA